jgi:hypothetical protein
MANSCSSLVAPSFRSEITDASLGIGSFDRDFARRESHLLAHLALMVLAALGADRLTPKGLRKAPDVAGVYIIEV